MAGSPRFNKPPVVETVLGVQFAELQGFRAVHFGLYWQSVRDRYPEATDQPRLDPVHERFPRPLMPPIPHLQMFQRTPPDRVWLTAQSKSELIQLQHDRFLFNWRGLEGKQYPSYETNSNRFFKEFEAFGQFCRNNDDLSEPVPESCEVTYVNHIEPLEGESAIELAGMVFSGLRWDTTENFLPTPENLTFNRSFVIHDHGKPIGRLYAEMSMAVRRQESGRREFILCKMTGRINHNANGDKSIMESMQIAHDWVVRGFVDLTDEQIQLERWERQR